MKNYCYNCVERCYNCHSNCENYKKYLKELNTIKKNKQIAKLLDNNYKRRK